MKLKKLETEKELKRAIELNNSLEELTHFHLNKDLEWRWKRAQEHLSELHSKYLDLVWYARSDKSKLLEEERYEALRSISNVENKYKQDCLDLQSDNGDWHHGFNSGMLAAIRLIEGMMLLDFLQDEEIEFLENPFNEERYLTEEGVAGFIYDGYEEAIDNFPELDS